LLNMRFANLLQRTNFNRFFMSSAATFMLLIFIASQLPIQSVSSASINCSNAAAADNYVVDYSNYPVVNQGPPYTETQYVKILQKGLVTLGYLPGETPITGDYDDITAAGVKSFKSTNALGKDETRFGDQAWNVLAQQISAAGCRPNIVVIMTDDMRYDDIKYMPNTQRLLVDRGVSFDGAVAASPLCCPSRASFLTGEYVHNHSVVALTYDNGGGHGTFFETSESSDTFPLDLQKEGYATVMLGKYLNQYPDTQPQELQDIRDGYIPPGWSDWHVFYDKTSSDGGPYYYDYTLNEDGNLVYYGKDASDYSTDILANKALESIDKYSSSGSPFFIFLSVFGPHNPATPADRDKGLSVSFDKSPSYNEADVSDKPLYVSNLPKIPYSSDTSYSYKSIRNNNKKRVRALQSVDEAVALLVAKLKADGVYDNTYIVFTSDHGYMLGEHRIPEGKRVPYEESVRVPLFIVGPSVVSGRTISDTAVSLVDMAPTFQDWASASNSGDAMDGVSLADLLLDPDRNSLSRRYVLMEFAGESQGTINSEDLSDTFSSTMTNWQAVRNKRYVYILYADGEQEFYDLAKDPYEMINVFTDSTYAKVLNRFQSTLSTLSTCQGDSCNY